MEAQELTKTLIDKTLPGKDNVVLFDSVVRGLFLKITPSDRRTWGLYYRMPNGQQRRPKIGPGALTVKDAREMAKGILADAAKGIDFSAKRTETRKDLTLAEFGKVYLSDYAKDRKKPKSYSENVRYLDKVIGPVLGSKRLNTIIKGDVARFHASLAKTPRSANCALSLLHAMFNVAIEWGHAETNPCTGVTKYAENKKERFLSAEELARLGKALVEAEDAKTIPRPFADLIRLLIFTGARFSEIRDLEWRNVDLINGHIDLEDSKTGARRIHLNKAAMGILEGIEGKREGLVIKGRREGHRLTGHWKIWQRIIKAAKVEPLRIHDLRHTHASVAVANNLGLPIVGKLLGHNQASTTARYSHLAADPIRAAAEVVGEHISAALAGKGAKVVDVAQERVADGKDQDKEESAIGR